MVCNAEIKGRYVQTTNSHTKTQGAQYNNQVGMFFQTTADVQRGQMNNFINPNEQLYYN